MKHQEPIFPYFNDSSKIEITMLDTMNAMIKCHRTSSGPGDIPYWVFNEFWDILAPPYNYVWNLSLKCGRYPQCYKNANLIPIPKTKFAVNAEQIRGISVTPISSRLFEKIIHQKYISPLIIARGDVNQFAFKKCRSTLDALAVFYNYIVTWIDRKDISAVHCISIDFSKVFDVLNQEIAYNKFSKFIDCNYLKHWLYDFSKNRKQRLVWKNKPLDYSDIDLGCSQGTVGGPNIFNIFTDDLRAVTKNSIYIKYADDTLALVPCFKYRNEDHLEDLNKELNNIFEWSRINQLPINRAKSKHIIFTLSTSHYCTCHPADIDLPVSNNLNYLGILFQKNLRFTQYMEKLIPNLNRKLFILRDLKITGFTAKSQLLAFNAFIIAKIRYGLPIYSTDKYSLDKLNKFIRKCTSQNIINENLNINLIAQDEDNKFLQRIVKDMYHPLNQCFSASQSHYPTRNKKRFLSKCASSNVATNSFVFRISRQK